MSAKEMLFEDNARHAICDGIGLLANVVKVTLGPMGRNAELPPPLITKDIAIKNPFLNVGIALGKKMAAQIQEESGDGVTTGIILLHALVKEGVKKIAAGANAGAIKKGMDLALRAILQYIDRHAKQITEEKEVIQIASIAAAQNEIIGETIAACFWHIGQEGSLTVEEGQGEETFVEIGDGLEISQGMKSHHFVTNRAKETAELENAYIFITDQKINTSQEIVSILQYAAGKNSALCIIAEEIEDEALSTLVMNKMQETLKVAAITTSGFGDQKKEILEDIAILTNGEVVSDIPNANHSVLGKALQIIVTKDKTTIVGGKGSSKAIQARLEQINAEIAAASSFLEKERLEKRREKLQGGIAIIQLGAETAPEMKKKRALYENSLHATRAALQEGIVPGGGAMLLHAAKNSEKPELSLEEQMGAEIVYKACEAPFCQIVKNSGFDPSIFIEKATSLGENFGFNALSEKIEDLLKQGVIDPVKIVKNSLSQAVSMAGMIMLTESIIAPEQKNSAS